MNIKVICTDRGRHPKRKLTPSGMVSVGAHPPGVPLTPSMYKLAYRFRCQTCGRDARIGEENWRKIIEGFAELSNNPDRVTVDVSDLPV